jgi:hypothetical protein
MKKSPLNHCSSDMMHSEAWNTMRKRSVVGKKSALSMLGISRKASPLNDMTAQENLAKGAFSVQADPTDSGIPWSTLTTEEIKALEGSGNRPPKQLYRGQTVYPNENIAWQTPEQAQATEDLENSEVGKPSWESKITEDEMKRLSELKANTKTNPMAHHRAELAYYNSLKSKYNN